MKIVFLLFFIYSCSSRNHQVTKLIDTSFDGKSYLFIFPNPNSQKAFNFLNDCLKGNFDQSQKNAASVLPENLNIPDFWSTLGFCFYLKKEYHIASFYFHQALTKQGISDNFRSIIFNNLAILNLLNLNILRANDYFLKSIALSSDKVVSHYNFALYLMSSGKFDESLSYLKLLLKKHHENEAFLILCSKISFLKRDYDSASLYLSRLSPSAKKRIEVASLKSLIDLFNNDPHSNFAFPPNVSKKILSFSIKEIHN